MNRDLQLFKALSDETRYKILELLLEGEKCVCEIIPYVERTQSTVSLQLGKLEDLDLLESRLEAKKIFFRLKDHTICDLFKAVGNKKGHILKKSCCKGDNDGS